jgi:uncharacterized membrane protein YgcG
MRTALATILAIAIVVIFGSAAFADDWIVVRLRGSVYQHVDGEWVRLQRGGMVPDSRVVRTMKTGNVEFQRGNETVTIGPDTQIQIFDEGDTKPFTTVKQYFGTVTIEAEVRQVQHFAVQTPYLAAVVKGTKFVVTSGDEGANVQVKRGHVFVEDKASKDSVTINARQSAGVSVSQGKAAALMVDGEPAAATDKESHVDADKSGKADNSGKIEKAAKADKDDKSGKGSSNEGNSGNGNRGNGNSQSGNSGSGGGNDNGNANGHDKKDKKDKD